MVMWARVSRPQGHESGRASSDTSQAQIHSFESAHPNIYPIYELLVHMKGPFLQIQNYRISMTQGNNKVFERSPSEVSVLME